MTVHPTADHADFWAAYKKHRPAVSDLPRDVADCFRLLDDLQRTCHDGCELDDADIGAIQGKLIVLRIILNNHHGVDTPQLGLP